MTPPPEPTPPPLDPIHKPLGHYFIAAQLVTPAHLEVALYDQAMTGYRLGEIMALRGWISQEIIDLLIETQALLRDLANHPFPRSLPPVDGVPAHPLDPMDLLDHCPEDLLDRWLAYFSTDAATRQEIWGEDPLEGVSYASSLASSLPPVAPPHNPQAPPDFPPNPPSAENPDPDKTHGSGLSATAFTVLNLEENTPNHSLIPPQKTPQDHLSSGISYSEPQPILGVSDRPSKTSQASIPTPTQSPIPASIKEPIAEPLDNHNCPTSSPSAYPQDYTTFILELDYEPHSNSVEV